MHPEAGEKTVTKFPGCLVGDLREGEKVWRPISG
jgi:hypothetical protein